MTDPFLSLFARQFEENRAYRSYSLSIGRVPDSLNDWRRIPPLPTLAFKMAEVACRPFSEAVRIFLSSGTSIGPAAHSRHPIFDLVLIREAILRGFACHLLPDLAPSERIPMLIVHPSAAEEPHSSLSFMFQTVLETFGDRQSEFFIVGGKLRLGPLLERLARIDRAAALLGTSLALARVMEEMESRTLKIPLPPGSRLMDTGGFKGKREIPRETLVRRYADRLGIPPTYCVNEYGMTELSSQFYDRVIGEGSFGYLPSEGLRTLVLDPRTLEEEPTGEVGVLAHFDLANVGSAVGVLTEDLGRALPNGRFELIGRAAGAEIRGCSLSIESMLLPR